MWKKISSKILFKHPRITLIEDLFELPNGEKGHYIYYTVKGSGVTIICKDGDKILLQKEYSYPPNEELFQFPGGHVPSDEKIEVGANRELMEEYGHRAEKLELLGKYLLDNRRSKEYMFVFLASNLVEDNRKEDNTEVFEHTWLYEHEVDEMIKAGEIKTPHSLASWSLYKSCS